MKSNVFKAHIQSIGDESNSSKRAKIANLLLVEDGIETQFAEQFTNPSNFVQNLAAQYFRSRIDSEETMDLLLEQYVNCDEEAVEPIFQVLMMMPNEKLSQKIRKRFHMLTTDSKARLAILLAELNVDSLPEILDILTETMMSTDQWLVQECTTLLVSIGKDATPLLTRMLSNQDPFAQQNATNALIAIGEPAIPDLVKALGSRNQFAQQNSFRALAEIGDPAVEAMTLATKSSNQVLQGNAQRWFAERRPSLSLFSLFKRG